MFKILAPLLPPQIGPSSRISDLQSAMMNFLCVTLIFQLFTTRMREISFCACSKKCSIFQGTFASGAANAGLTLAQGAGTAAVSAAQDIAARGSSAGALVSSLVTSVLGASSSAASSAATAVGSRVLGIGAAAVDPNAPPPVRIS